MQLKENEAVIYAVDGFVEFVEPNARKFYARSDVLMQSDHRSRAAGMWRPGLPIASGPPASGLDCASSPVPVKLVIWSDQGRLKLKPQSH